MLLGCVWLLYHCACFVLYGVVYSGTFPDVILVHGEFLCVCINNHVQRALLYRKEKERKTQINK